jgi:hypothetical protein
VGVGLHLRYLGLAKVVYNAFIKRVLNALRLAKASIRALTALLKAVFFVITLANAVCAVRLRVLRFASLSEAL